MGIAGIDTNNTGLATTGNDGKGEPFRKATRTKSLLEDYGLLCFGFVMLCGMLTFDVSELLGSGHLPSWWWYWLFHLAPVLMMAVAIYVIRHELNLRKRVENGEVAIFFGRDCIFIIPTEGKKSFDELIKNVFDSHENTPS